MFVLPNQVRLYWKQYIVRFWLCPSDHQTGHSIPNDNKDCESFLSKYFNRVPDLHFEADICIDQNIDLSLESINILLKFKI